MCSIKNSYMQTQIHYQITLSYSPTERGMLLKYMVSIVILEEKTKSALQLDAVAVLAATENKF